MMPRAPLLFPLLTVSASVGFALAEDATLKTVSTEADGNEGSLRLGRKMEETTTEEKDCFNCPDINDIERDEPPVLGDMLPYGSKFHFGPKIDFPAYASEMKQHFQETYMPLGPDDYPLDEELCDVLRESGCPSVVMPYDHEVKGYDIGELVASAGGPPFHAPTSEFWRYFERVVDYQIKRREVGSVRCMSETAMPWLNLPDLWQDFTCDEVAEAVHDEYPGLWQAKLLGEFAKQKLQPDNEIIPKRCKVQFLHGIVAWAGLNTWSINIVGPKNFAAKYWVGRARPEEVALAVHCSIAEGGSEAAKICGEAVIFDPKLIPESIKKKIASMKLTKMQDFGKYPEGCPMHPSWPAMHSAASCMSSWLPVVANLTEEQFEQVKLTDLAVSMARTVAGVHYIDDNCAGLKMGQIIVERELPGYLAKTFGADEDKVREKLEKVRIDWDKECDKYHGDEFISSMA